MTKARRNSLRCFAIRPALLPALLLALPPAARAAEVVIRVPADQPTLAAAVSAVPNGGTIELAPGTYASPAAGFAFSNLGKGFTLRGASGGAIFLDGGNARPVLRMENSTPAAGKPIVFENLTFRNGSSASSSVAGGVTIRHADATFVDCVFDNNQRFESIPTELAGGGVGVTGDSLVFFHRALFDNNRAKNNGGGMSISNGATVYVHESRFLSNRTDVAAHRNTAAGGAISVINARLFVTNSRFQGNRSGYVAGAIFALGAWTDPVDTPTAEVVVANSAFLGNQAFPNGVANPGPSEAGAVHAEDQATVSLFHSRFEGNAARTGGAVNLYRGVVNVDQSIFIGNRADDSGGGGFGGTFNVLSNDTSSADPNRRSGSLTVRRSFIQGVDAPDVLGNGRSGGCLSATGDFNRRKGTVTPQGSAATTRASVTLEDVVFHDCEVTGASNPAGGAFNAFLVDFQLSDALVLASGASGAGASGGGGRLSAESVGSITNTTFARNTATVYAGGLWLSGSDVDVTGSRFVRNEVSPGTAEPITSSLGAGLFTAGQDDWPTSGIEQDQTGTVSGTVFSDNVGLAVFDDDRNGAGLWINDQRYNGNTFFGTTFGTDVYSDSLACCKTAAELNDLVVTRAQGNTTKSQVDNSQPGSAPVVLDLRIVPTEILEQVPVGDTAPTTSAFAGFGWSGGAASFDGSTVTGFAGALPVDAGAHLLSVAGEDVNDSATIGPTPGGEVTADPAFISGGGSSDLDWDSFAGDLIAIGIDQGVGELGAASGTTAVSPPATTTYRSFFVTEQGGLLLETTVFVNEPDALFIDGFGSGNAGAWSEVVP